MTKLDDIGENVSRKIIHFYRLIKQIKRRMRFFLEIFFYAVGVGLTFLYVVKLIDWQLLVTMWVAEISIGIFLNYLLSESRTKFDVLQKFEAKAKYAYLEIHRADNWIGSDYPYPLYYIVNTRTKKAYWVSEEIHRLVVARIISDTYKVSQEELLRYIMENSITVEGRYPEPRELMIESDRSPSE